MKPLSILLLILFLFACNNEKQKLRCFTDEEKEMFKIAFDNNSTGPSYIVINVQNKKTGEIKEICCDGETLKYAMKINELSTTSSDKYFNSCAPLVQFSEVAIKYIGFKQYKTQIIDSLRIHLDKNLINKIKIESEQRKYELLDSLCHRFPLYFEHFLFKNKILTCRDCESGFTVIQKIY